jgi:hypothetical protein
VIRLRLGPVYGPPPAVAETCWLVRPFTVVPATGQTTPPDLNAGAASSKTVETLETALTGVVIVGAVGGTVYCGYKCPEPWDTAVPVGLVALVTGSVIYAVARYKQQ